MKKNKIRLVGNRAQGARMPASAPPGLPDSSFPPFDQAALTRKQGPRSGVSAIFGSWPGDETDEELRGIVDEVS